MSVTGRRTARQDGHSRSLDGVAARVTGAASGEGSRRQRPARHRRRRKGSLWRELPILIVTALVLTFLIQTFVARVFVIPSASMEPTLHGCTGCSNDRVVVDKVVYNFGSPSPGDVIVFSGPPSWVDEAQLADDGDGNVFLDALHDAAAVFGLAEPDEKDFVKRVIATEGQTVRCCDARNRVVVNGEPLVEPYIQKNGEPQQEFGPVTVPPGTVWVMGDNRNNSADSRAHIDDPRHGAIPVENVIGKVRAIVLPPGRWSWLDHPNPQKLTPQGSQQ